MENKENRFIELLTDLITHEFKTPISTISGFSELLSTNQGLSDEKKSEYLKLINEQSNYLAVITDCIVDICRMEIANFKLNEEKVNLSEIIKKKIHKLNRLNNSEFINDKINGKFEATIDYRKIISILEIIIINLKKYMDKDTQIEISEERKDEYYIINFKTMASTSGIDSFISKFDNEFKLSDLSHTNPASIHWIKKIIDLYKGGITLEKSENGVEIKIKLRV